MTESTGKYRRRSNNCLAYTLASLVRFEGDCIIFTGTKHDRGYGVVTFNHKHYLAHRLSYSLFVGPVPSDKLVCHTCDNRRCVNPKHLFIGTAQDNADDMMSKGRHRTPYSEANAKAKLTYLQAEEIRRLYSKGISGTELAFQFSVSDSTIYAILGNHSYTKPAGLYQSRLPKVFPKPYVKPIIQTKPQSASDILDGFDLYQMEPS